MLKKYVLPILALLVFLLSSCSAQTNVSVTSLPDSSASALSSQTCTPSQPPVYTYSAPPSILPSNLPEETSSSVSPDEDNPDDESIDTADGDDEDTGEDEDSITNSPLAAGYGSLPKSLLGISPMFIDSFSPDKAADYLLSAFSEFDNEYFIDKGEYKNGTLYLYLTDYVSIDADKAYQYLKKTFSLSDKAILALPLFADTNKDSGCKIHGGKMYTADQWEIEKADDWPEDYDEEYDYNGIELKEIVLPSPVPLASSANITLVDYEDAGDKKMTVKQLKDLLLDADNSETDGGISGNLYFKYSGGKITAMAEEYSP